MYGKCKNCKKIFSCWNPFGVEHGYCETAFEPKAEKPLVTVKMAWQRLSSKEWEAKGELGKFRIVRSHGKFWAEYLSDRYPSFVLGCKQKLSEAKNICEDNLYWE